MQTDTRNIRVILAKAYGGKHSDKKHCDTADLIYKEITGKDNPKRDPLTGWLEMGQAKTAEMQEVTDILTTFERELRRRDDLAGKDTWRDFARGFVRKEQAAGKDYRRWLTWFCSDQKRMEWAWKETPESIRARWDMAFEKPVIKERVPAGV